MAGVVLIAIDSSQQAETAFEWYLKTLHRPGNVIAVLHCVDLGAIATPDDVDSSDKAFSHLWEQQRGKIKALEDKYRWKLNENGLAGRIHTQSGKPGEVIVAAAKKEKAGLVVIGSRGLSRVKRTFQGSVSDHVLHKAPCPVCICRLIE